LIAEEEIYVETNPLEDIKEQNLRSIDAAAQHFAAQNIVALNYLTVDYMKHRDFSVDGLSEQVQQSEQVVKQSFISLMESPEATTKKLLSQIRRHRPQSRSSASRSRCEGITPWFVVAMGRNFWVR
jgi:hypothetical protein